ncbi:MAG: hypothetical protein KAS32_15855 [Candidatus Peribacteraceae bacterium]|nr:hypothetical protein [Candidatus Peribacteraceae bacterium]
MAKEEIPTIKRDTITITIQISHDLLNDFEGRTFKINKFENLDNLNEKIILDFEEVK